MGVCVMQMLLQRVKESVAVSFTGLIEAVTTQDAHKDLSEDLTHSDTHRVALHIRGKQEVRLR